MPSERPILFSDPMVRAILDGRKTQTRRVLKVQPLARCPYGVPGDLLWVRECWALASGEDGGVFYRADNADGPWSDTDKAAFLDGGRWRPSIHMPRWASRLTLRVTDVRVERLQSISEEDARWEGIGLRLADEMPPDAARRFTDTMRKRGRAGAFGLLWDSINGDGAWAANPWVWVVGFERVEAAPASPCAHPRRTSGQSPAWLQHDPESPVEEP